ncbi:MAG TPA: peptidoglycan-binding protein [Nitrospirales bacterium]|nr:peptidoglycan-binding protein [Nitrospirales bacterium]
MTLLFCLTVRLLGVNVPVLLSHLEPCLLSPHQVNMPEPTPTSQRLPRHLERGVIAVMIGVLGFGVWLGWVMKPEERPVDTSVIPVTTAPTDITVPTEPSGDYWVGPAGFVQTSQESQTAQAAMVTLLNQWSRLNQFNPEKRSNGPGALQMDSFPFELPLLERLDYPAVITWQAEELAPLTSAVLFALNADTATILDPLSGVLDVKRERLSERVTGDAKIFWRPLPGLFPPFQGKDMTKSLRTLQQLLGQLGFGNKNEEGTLEQRAEEGIRELQQFYGFKPTGVFTKEVHLVLGKEMHGQQVPSLMLSPLLENSDSSAGPE